jgi:hypothetical protein
MVFYRPRAPFPSQDETIQKEAHGFGMAHWEGFKVLLQLPVFFASDMT